MNKDIAVRFNKTQLTVYVNDDRLYIMYKKQSTVYNISKQYETKEEHNQRYFFKLVVLGRW